MLPKGGWPNWVVRNLGIFYPVTGHLTSYGPLEFDPERIRASSWTQKHIFGYGKWKFWSGIDKSWKPPLVFQAWYHARQVNRWLLDCLSVVAYFSGRLIDCLIHSFIHCSIDWLIDRMLLLPIANCISHFIDVPLMKFWVPIHESMLFRCRPMFWVV